MSEILVNTVDNQPIEIYWQDEVELQLDLNLMYIKSGQKEIQDYVDNVSKPEIDSYIKTEAKPIVSKVVNTIAEPLVNEYVETTTKPAIDEYFNDKKPEIEDLVNQASNYANNSQTSAEASAASAAAALTSANKAKTSETNAKTSETNALSSKNAAASSATAASSSANNAKIWAEGTDAQVQALGGEKSAKGWAEASTNLDYTNITNCITKIPQDIKLELSNSTLTLKSGSKVYDGNGLLKTITEQTNQNYNITAGTRIFLYEIERNTIVSFSANRLASGDSLPADNTNCDIFYLTSDKKVYRYLNSVWSANAGYSFPICIATTDGVGVTSIDQVFNGFGYIGSTIFALPGVEGLIPNGRNTDGSLNNTKFKTSRVLSQTNESTYKGNLAITSTSFVASSYTEYNEDENFNKTSSGENYPWCFCGGVVRESGRITSFNPKLPVKLADDQDVVHKTGNETIEGNKTFLPDARTIYLKDNGTVLEDSPSINRYPCRFIWTDRNNQQLGYAQVYEYPDGRRNVGMGIMGRDGTYRSLSMWVDANNYAYTTCPTPVANDKSTKIATTEWVRNYGAILDYSAGITITGNGDKTAPKNGVLMINASTLDNQGNEQVTLVIESQTFYFGNGTVNLDIPHIGQIYFPMKSGQSYNISSPRWNKITARFFPYV